MVLWLIPHSWMNKLISFNLKIWEIIVVGRYVTSKFPGEGAHSTYFLSYNQQSVRIQWSRNFTKACWLHFLYLTFRRFNDRGFWRNVGKISICSPPSVFTVETSKMFSLERLPKSLNVNNKQPKYLTESINLTFP